jgi:hypothetical protein
VYQYAETLSGSPSSGNYGFGAAPTVGGSDTDGDDVYAFLANGTFVGSSYSGTLLTGSGFGLSYGTGLAIAVLSTNEH